MTHRIQTELAHEHGLSDPVQSRRATHSMGALRILFAVIFVAMVAYTLPVIWAHGLNIIPIFFSDLLRLDWTGQFVFDFGMFLGLAALWIAWRHGFGGSGFALGLATIFGGMTFLAAYLFWQTGRVASIEELLLGQASGSSSGGA